MEDFEQSHNYEMIKERMKERPINRKKLVRRTAITVSMAVIFGVFACITFLVLEPVISNILYPEPAPEEVILPEEMEEILPEDMLITEEKPQPEPTVQVQKYELDVLENYDSLSKEQKIKLLSEMQEDSQWLIRMVENLLSITRIDSDTNKVKVKKTDTVLEELIDTVVVKFYTRYPNQKIELELPDEFISIPMDAMLIQQVLMNILENAMHHAKGMEKLEFCVKAEVDSVLFKISDDGCGIPYERMKNIFNGYFNNSNEVSDGTRNNMGIGLSVCAAIIKAHDGEIWAENRAGGGTSFCFRLKMGDSEDE